MYRNPARQSQTNISGDFSGNSGSHNVSGSHNNNRINTGILANFTNNGQVYVLRAGDRELEQASRPYRMIPYCRNTRFTGRGDLIESLRRFSEGNGHNRTALHGLGGSGKTQIALEYVYQRASESDCDVFWVHGSGVAKFSEGFRAIAQHVGIPLASTETDEEGFLLIIKRWFESADSGDWILVIDNADNEDDFIGNSGRISKFVPQGPRGTLIFTTRSRQVALRQGCERIDVGEMEENESRALILKRLGDLNSSRGAEQEAITMILESVHHIPLAIVGAAAFMTETQTPPSAYWTIFRVSDEQAKRLLSQPFSDIQREVDMTESILATYFITFDRITRQIPLAADLLRLIAFFDRQNIPEELLSKSGLEGIDDQIQFRQAIGKLLGFSLVATVEREERIFYELHRLVQLSLQVYLPTEELSRWRATALGVVSSLFPRHWTTWRDVSSTYIPHVVVVTKDSTDPIAEELCFRLGRYFLDMGSYNNAETQLRRCIVLREEGKEYDWDKEGPSRVICLGLINIYQGKPKVAESMLRRLLEDIEKSLDPNHPIVLDAIHKLAYALCDQGKYNESEMMMRRELEGCRNIYGPDHPSTLVSVNNLATLLQEQGKYDEAEMMHRHELEACEKILGPDHPDTLMSISNLATTLKYQGKYRESEMMHRRVLEERDRILGPDHPNTLGSVGSLATVLQDQGKYNESEAMHRRALEGHETILGSDHPDTLGSVGGLATVLQDQGKHNESEAMHRRALEGHETILGPDHPSTLTSFGGLATVLQDQGRYDESETMLRRVVKAQQEALGPDHPNTLLSVNNLAMALQSQGKYSESETMHRRALEGREKILGPAHPKTLASFGGLATVLKDQGTYGESETMLRHVVEGQQETLGPDHPNTLLSVNNLAVALQSQGKYSESETMHRRALEGREKILGPAHPYTLSSASNLATVVRLQGESGV